MKSSGMTNYEELQPYIDTLKGHNYRLSENLEKQDVSKADKITDFIEDLYDLRKSSIANEGEYGLGNLVFKEMRALGYLDNLRKIKNEIVDKNLSLENLCKNFSKKKIDVIKAFVEALMTGECPLSSKSIRTTAKNNVTDRTAFINQLSNKELIACIRDAGFVVKEIDDKSFEVDHC